VARHVSFKIDLRTEVAAGIPQRRLGCPKLGRRSGEVGAAGQCLLQQRIVA